jgi:hypothetical protein
VSTIVAGVDNEMNDYGVVVFVFVGVVVVVVGALFF